MSTQDVLNIFLILALFIITSCVVYVSYYFVQVLKSMMNITENVDQATESIKNTLQMKALAAIPALLVALVGKVMKKGR